MVVLIAKAKSIYVEESKDFTKKNGFCGLEIYYSRLDVYIHGGKIAVLR